MARYTGPVYKKSRRLGFSCLENGKELGNIEALENEVLYENNSNFYGISNIFSDDDKTIYYSNTTGLYKCELGSKEVEQIVEGSLSSIGDDNMYIRTFVVGKDNTFLACGQDYNSYEGGFYGYNVLYLRSKWSIHMTCGNILTIYVTNKLINPRGRKIKQWLVTIWKCLMIRILFNKIVKI